MKPLPQSPDLLAVAERVVWFKPPADALAEPVHFLAHFLAHVMTFGTARDLKALNGIIGLAEFEEVLDQAPPGIFDQRSWAYWHVKCGRSPAPPLPARGLGVLPRRRTVADK